MKLLLRVSAALVAVLIARAATGAGEFPSADLSNGLIKARLYLPDVEKGSYRGTRFDWSGIIGSLEYEGHTYFGQWYARHDPLVNDAITGPVQEFFTQTPGVGYDAANPGGPFVRLGAGVVMRPAERGAPGRRRVKIVNPGKWVIKRGPTWIEFTHRLDDAGGYEYVYTKRIALASRAPEMTISQEFRNTGTKVIEAEPYNHNFLVLDGQPSGPGLVVRFRFVPRAVAPLKGLVEIRGNEIHYLRELKAGESVLTLLEGFGQDAGDYDIVVENRNTGAGVRIVGDRPLSKVQFWSIRTTVCPEPFIKLRVEPGKTVQWSSRYRFFTTRQMQTSHGPHVERASRPATAAFLPPWTAHPRAPGGRNATVAGLEARSTDGQDRCNREVY